MASQLSRAASIVAALIVTASAVAENTITQGSLRALPEGKLPEDARLGALRTTRESYFPMQPVKAIKDWPARREEIRTRVLVAAGLHPLPQRLPLNAQVFGKVEREDYTVERVIFESFPAHFVSGSLYRPKSPPKGKLPAVLNPHGHWKNGRFHDHGEELVRKEIAAGAERFEVGGRHVIQARCVQLARMGCIAFVYDMEGNADSVQLSHNLGLRPQEPGKPGYLFFSPQAELHGQTMFGLQTWNSIRALDFICALPEVDKKRIAVTGASGGGTQTMILSAVDDRIAAAFPAVMVSASMQGGCTCENAAYLRINQGNVDIAAVTAPRPLGLICADDWTKEMATKGSPDLQRLYEMLGHPDAFEAHYHLQFPHNYNSVNRQHMYEFMNRHLKLGLPEPIVERDYLPLDPQTEASVWTAQHPKPAGGQVGEAHERQLTAQWTEATKTAFDQMSQRQRTRTIVVGLNTIVGRRPSEVGPVIWRQANQTDAGDGFVSVGTLTVERHGEQLPALFITPKQNANGQVAIWLTDSGKDGLFGVDGQMISGVKDLVRQGFRVAGVDLFGQGEFVKGGGKAVESARLVPSKDADPKAACFTFGYNPPLFVQRVQDVMSLVEFLQHGDGAPAAKRIHLVALGQQSGPVGLAALALLGERIAKAAVDVKGFDFATVNRLDDPMSVPGILRYGGMEALWALNRSLPTAKVTGAEAAVQALATGRASAGLSLEERIAAEPVGARIRAIKAPFAMPQLKRAVFPNRAFTITDYGAVAGGTIMNTEAFRQAIAAGHAAGGGKVVVPAGKWLTGPIHLKSNVHLYLSAGSELIFSDRFEDYLPVVFTRWEGVECYNYSPLIYAKDCENIAITGPGLLNGNGARWWGWQKRSLTNGVIERLLTAQAGGIAVKDRVFGTPEDAVRPAFINPVNCTNVLLEGFTLKDGPFWSVQFLYCENAIARKLTFHTHHPNGDGVNSDSSRNILIEYCFFDTDDDAIAIKSGKNEDAWRVGKSSKNIVIRDCYSKGPRWGSISMGSEMSGGIRNIYVRNVKFDGTLLGFQIKTKPGRGGVVENVWVEDIEANHIAGQIFFVNTAYGADTFSPPNPVLPRIRNVSARNIRGTQAEKPYARPVEITGLQEMPVENIQLKNVFCEGREGMTINHARGVKLEQVRIQAQQGPPVTIANSEQVEEVK
jgi:polygalacturonase/dienelactone hydrolase